MSRVHVAILGASGLVSQRMQQRLATHPWFELVAVAGQSPSTKLSDIEWHLDEPRPELLNSSEINILDINGGNLAEKLKNQNVTAVFSALPSEPASRIEAKLVSAGLHVFSNASAFRMHPEVSLVVADVNPDALRAPAGQAIHACATNCTLIPILHPLSVLSQQYNVTKVVVRTEQALSGAGWKLLHNRELKTKAVDQEIPGEAEKIVEEIERILDLNAEWDVQTKRVDERDGHIVHVEVHVDNAPTYDMVASLFQSKEQTHALPSQPTNCMECLQSEPSRAEHLWNGQSMNPLDPSVDLKAGMTTTFQLKSVKNGVISFIGLSHNTIRGAAGGVVLLAELAYIKKYFEQ
ncbi:MAG: Aspartate-semialdehyde dehydrogenase [Candidatus Poseidoniaceae archaeon]|nr:MAG: Aspartate-semialdehyde dehydrogenase [Candidatus Poseidoniaceae archaeon]